MWDLKQNDSNEFIYKTEIDLHTKKRNLWIPKGDRDKLGVWEQQIHIALQKIDKQHSRAQGTIFNTL